MISAQGDCGKWQRQRLDRVTSSPPSPFLPCQHHLSVDIAFQMRWISSYKILIFATLDIATNLLLLPANTISLNHLSWSATNSFSNEVNIFLQKNCNSARAIIYIGYCNKYLPYLGGDLMPVTQVIQVTLGPIKTFYKPLLGDLTDLSQIDFVCLSSNTDRYCQESQDIVQANIYWSE